MEENEENKAPAIFVITQLMELIRQLPMKFFDDIDNRAHILESMQAELDELIIIEEQSEEEIGENSMENSDQDEEMAEGSETVIEKA